MHAARKHPRRLLFSLGTHYLSTGLAWEYVGGLSHNQCIQTLQKDQLASLAYSRHGLLLWGRILACVAVADVSAFP